MEIDKVRINVYLNINSKHYIYLILLINMDEESKMRARPAHEKGILMKNPTHLLIKTTNLTRQMGGKIAAKELNLILAKNLKLEQCKLTSLSRTQS